MDSSSIYKEILKKVQSEFCKKNILVAGDVMVDEYITGKVARISPEAPVPVLDFRARTLQAGGACNVANNINALGANTSVIGTAALDDSGMWLRDYFKNYDIDVTGLIAEEGRPTTTKTRYATKGQQLLRVDREITKGISQKSKDCFLNIIKEKLISLDGVVLSDYRKGMFEDADFVQEIISDCNKAGVFVSIDSKSRNIRAFRGADFVKPNNLELEEAVGIRIEDEDSLNKAGEKYLDKCGAKALVVTRGAKGISLFRPGAAREDFSARDVQVYDVCGAGDTVISTISMASCSNLDMDSSIRLANLAAGIVISKVGTVPVELKELEKEIKAQCQDKTAAENN